MSPIYTTKREEDWASPNFFVGVESSENFWRDSAGAQKKGFPNFSPAMGFFYCIGTENR